MIYCVWYPGGGFGHFINAVLTLHGNNFVRPKKQLKFSENGNSHDLDLVVPKYYHGYWPNGVEFCPDKNYCVLVDNGNNDSKSDAFRSTFPNATVIKICYSKFSWPVVARAMIEKAMDSTLEEQLPIDIWNTQDSWAQREKYFLFLRDHPLRHAWQATNEQCLDVGEIYEDYDKFYSVLNSIVKTDHFHDLWREWRRANAKYIGPATNAKNILSNIITGQHCDLSHITDVWSQAVIYYVIWLKYCIEVPHNDYANWFTNTNEIAIMLRDNGVDI